MSMRIPLKLKLWSPVVVCLMAFLTLAVFSAYQMRENAYVARKHAMKDMVDAADALLEAIAADVQAGKLTEQMGRDMAIARTGNLRYGGGTGYVTTITPESTVLNNPASPKVNGKDMSGFQDAHGKFMYREIAQIGRSPDGAGLSTTGGRVQTRRCLVQNSLM